MGIHIKNLTRLSLQSERLKIFNLIYFSTLTNVKISKACECKVRKFDPHGVYKRHAKHMRDLFTYAWKPIIIQVIRLNVTFIHHG